MRRLAFVLVVASLVVLAGQPASALSLGGIRNSLVQWVLDKVSIEDVFEITVEEVRGDEEAGTTLVDVAISDAEGVWFTAERLSFDFNKTRLLRGQLFIENLELEGVEMFRQPVIPAGEEIEVNLEGTEAPPEAPFYWPRSPITTAIQRMSLQDVFLHEEVLGQAIRFDATGSFRDQGDTQSAELSLRRTDEVEGAIDLDYSRNFDAEALTLNLDAAEAPGGIVSALAGLPADVPVKVTLNAEGTPDDFETTFDLGLTDFLQAAGTATIDYSGPLGVDATFTARPGAKMPQEYAQILGEQAELVVQAQEGPDQTVQIEAARISSPYLNATLSGTYARDTGVVDVQVGLAAEPGLAEPFEGIEFAGLRFDGTVQGALGSLSADGQLTLDGFETPQVSMRSAVLEIDVGQSGPADTSTAELDIEGLVQGLRLDQVGPDVIGEARIRLDASITGDEVLLETARIDSEPLNLSASGAANIATMDFEIDFGADAPALAPILAVYGIDGEGAIEASGHAVSEGGVLTLTASADLKQFVSDFAEADRLHLEGTVVQSTERTTFDLTGTGEQLGIGEVGPDLLERADLAVNGTLVGDVLTLDTGRIDSPVLDASAEGRVNTATSTGQVTFEAASDNLAPVAEAYGFDLQGALEANGTVELTPEGMSLAASADATDLAGDVEAERLRVEAEVDQAAERTAFSVTAESDRLSIALEGEELTGPVDLAVEGAVVGDELTLDTARISSPIIDATIDGALNLGDLTGRVAYDVEEARLAALSPVLGVEATGVLSAEGVADLTGATVGAEGTATVQDLSVYGTEIGDLAATYDLALADVPEGTLRLELTDSPYAPDAPTVFALEMGGPPGEWAADFDLSAPNYLQADGSATVNWEGPLSVDASVSARPEPALPQEWAQLIGEEATLVVRAAEGEDRTVRIDTARLSSPVLNAQVSGTYSMATGAADLEVDLQAEPELAAPFEGVEFAGLRFEGEVTGEPGSLTADGDLMLQGFSSEQLAVESAVLEIDIGQTGTAEAPTTNINVAGTVSGLRVAQVGPELVGDARLALDASLTGDVLAIDEARIDSQLLQLWAEGTANVSTVEFDLDYNLATPAIAPLADAFLGMRAEGAVTAAGRVTSTEDGLALETRAELTNFRSDYADAERLQIDGTVAQEGDRTAFDLTGSGQGLRVDQIGADLLGDAQFTAKGVLDGNELALDALRIDSPVIEATAQGNVNLETGEGRLEYDVSDVALGVLGPLYDLPVGGTAAAEGVLGLASDAAAGGPRLVGEARIGDLVYAGTTVGDLELTHDVVLSETPHGTLQAALTSGPYAPATVEAAFRLEGQRLVLDDLDARAFGVSAGGDLVVNLDTMGAEGALTLRATEGPFAPAEATVQLRMEGDRLVLADLRARAFGLSAAGDIAVNLETLLAEGALRIDDADLAALGELIGAPVAGDAQGTIRLSGERGQQVATVDLAVTGLTAAGVAIGQAQMQGRISDVLGTPRVDLSMAAERVVSDDLRLAVANLTAQGPLSGVVIALDGRGELDDAPLTIAGAAQADLAGAAMRVTVSQLDLVIGDDRIAVLSPMTLVYGGSVLRVQDMAIALPDNGRLNGEIAYHGGTLVGDIVLDAPDISFLSRLFDVPVEAGALRVAGTFDTRRGSAGAELTVTGREILVADIAGSNVMSIDAALDWDGRILNLDAQVGGFDEPLVVRASVPVRPTAGFPELADSGPVSASIRWQGEIGDLWALVPLPGHVLTGDAKIDIGVTGDISSPTFTGGILLADGIYQNLDYGTILTGISIATTIESTGELGLRLDAVDASQGTVRVEGRVGLGDRGIDLTVETRRAVVVRRDDAIIRVDADLRIHTQPDGQMVVSGDVTILEAEIRLVLDNPPTIVTLGEVRIKGQPIVVEDEGVSLPIALNIDVNAPGRIFVRGRGLTSEWMIDVDVRGTVSEPRITGEVAAVRGTLDLLGREFELERGRVLFNGGPEIDPRLDVSLVRESDDITGRIVISGTASDPELSLTSTPALPEEEVLPRLLFGTSAEALTPAQGIQLALGLATLMNGGGGTLDQVRAGLGLDTLGIGQDEDGAALEVGKQVTEDVWVGTRQSLEGGGTSVAVEVDVFRNVDAYGEVSTGGETSVGVQWKKDF